MRVLLRLALPLLACAAAGAPAAASDQAQALLEGAAADCRDYESGEFTASPSAVTAVDLTGDGIDDEIVDEGFFL